MESIKVLAMVEEAGVHDLKRRELIKYVLKLRKFVLKQNDKIVYQKGKISQLVSAESVTQECMRNDNRVHFIPFHVRPIAEG